MAVRIHRLAPFALVAPVALLISSCGGSGKTGNAFQDSTTGTSTNAGGSTSDASDSQSSSTNGAGSGGTTTSSSGGSGGETTSTGGQGGSGGDATGTGGTPGSGGDTGGGATGGETASGSGGSAGSGGETTDASGGSAGSVGTAGSGGSGGTAGSGGSGGTAGSGGSGGSGGSVGGTVTVTDSCEQPACGADGGDLMDTSWTYTGVCVEEGDVMDPLLQVCEDIELVSVSGSVEGTLDFMSNTFEQDASVSIDATVYVPSTCPQGSNCTLLQTIAATLGGLTGVQCDNDTENPDDCVCVVPLDTQMMNDGSYSTDGTSLTLGANEFEYCADGDTLLMAGEAQSIPFVYQLTSQ